MLPEPNYPARPEQFIGRRHQIEAFEEALRYSTVTRRMASFAVLGESGIGKSSLLLKFVAVYSKPQHGMLPVILSVCIDLGDYLRFAESLLDRFAGTLAAKSSLAIRVRSEVRNWGLKRDYLFEIGSFAEPAVRFYKLYLGAFTPQEASEHVDSVFGIRRERSLRLSRWLYQKTLGHPYCLAFISGQLLARARGSPPESPARHWPEIFRQLEREKFRTDLVQLSEKNSELLRAFARGDGEEFAPSQVGQQFDRVYFRRLTDRGLLVRTRRGQYKLYHPLFKLFLQGLKP